MQANTVVYSQSTADKYYQGKYAAVGQKTPQPAGAPAYMQGKYAPKS